MSTTVAEAIIICKYSTGACPGVQPSSFSSQFHTWTVPLLQCRRCAAQLQTLACRQMDVSSIILFLFIVSTSWHIIIHSQYKKGRVTPTTENSIIKRRKVREVSPCGNNYDRDQSAKVDFGCNGINPLIPELQRVLIVRHRA